MAEIRPAAVAGSFYPAHGPALRSTVEGYLDVPSQGSPIPKAVIAPHAGYAYSGAVAGSVLARLISARAVLRRVVIVGPAHRAPVAGIAVSRAPAFRTPLGDVPVDIASVDLACTLARVQVSESAHAAEHSIEVQLPFLQVALASFAIVPLLVGRTSADEVAQVLQALWGGSDTVVVVSTDLSHYLPYVRAVSVDGATAEAIESVRPEQIADDQACGAVALRALLQIAQRLGMSVERVDLRNSGDTAGPRDHVVGYGAFALA